MDLTGSGHDFIVEFYRHGDEPSVSIKESNFLTNCQQRTRSNAKFLSVWRTTEKGMVFQLQDWTRG